MIKTLSKEERNFRIYLANVFFSTGLAILIIKELSMDKDSARIKLLAR